MSTSIRYSIATMTTLLLLLGPFGWAIQFRQSFRAKYARLLRDAEVARGNAAAASLSDDEILADGFGVELPADEVFRIWISDMLFKFWWFWGLFVLALSYGLFVFLGWLLPGGSPVPQVTNTDP